MFFTTRKIDPKVVWGIKEDYDKGDGLITKGFKLEAQGRKIASDREGTITDKVDAYWAYNLGAWHIDIIEVIENLAMMLDRLVTEDEKNAFNDGQIVAHIIAGHITRYLLDEKRNIFLKDILPPDDFSELIEYLKWYDESQYEVTGHKGIWLYGHVPDEKYSYATFINDLTSVFHQLLNYIMRTYQNLVVIVPDRVYSVGGDNPYLEKLTLDWWNNVKYLNSTGIYYGDDFKPLCAFIKSNEVELRVGSSEGHMAHIEFRLRGIVVDYYDTDEPVHEVFMRLVEYYGCRIVEHVPDRMTKVFCPSLNESDVKFMKVVLPFVTSMDLRIGSPHYDYWAYWYNNYEECKQLYRKYTREDLEYYLCLIVGEKLLGVGKKYDKKDTKGKIR